MPTDALDILPLATAKGALRIDDTAGDADLTASIKASVDYCQRLAGKPFLDITENLYIARPALSDSPMRIPRRYVRSISDIAYWQKTQKLREDPSGEVLLAYADPGAPQDDEDPIGRTQEDGYDTLVWPPSAGWPEVLTDSAFLVTVVLGYATADVIPGIEGIRKAVTLQAGVYYDGIVEDMHREAVLRLLEPYRDARGFV